MKITPRFSVLESHTVEVLSSYLQNVDFFSRRSWMRVYYYYYYYY